MSDTLNWDAPEESVWEEAEVVDEESAEDESEPLEEDSEEEPEEDVDGEEEAEEEVDETDYQEIAGNMEKAMQAERGKRKEATDIANSIAIERDQFAQQANFAQQQLDGLMSQLKKLELDDVVKLPEVQQRDPQIEKLLQQQQVAEQQQQVEVFYQNMFEEVGNQVSQFPNLDTENESQGEVLAQMVTQASLNGMSMDQAVQASLTQLNDLLGTTVSSYKKKREPAVKPRRKIKSATRAKSAPASQRRAKELDNGDFSGFFRDMGSKMAGE